MDLPPTHQHQGQTATRDTVKWERGLMHDPVEKYTPGRTHDGTLHVWIHPSVVGNSFGGKLFVDDSLMCKHGSQSGQSSQIHETSHELVCSAHGATQISLPVQRRILRAELWALWQGIILSEPRATFISDCATVPEAWNEGRNGVQQREGWMLMRGGNLGMLPRHWRRSPHRLRDEMIGAPVQSGASQAG